MPNLYEPKARRQLRIDSIVDALAILPMDRKIVSVYVVTIDENAVDYDMPSVREYYSGWSV